MYAGIVLKNTYSTIQARNTVSVLCIAISRSAQLINDSKCHCGYMLHFDAAYEGEQVVVMRNG